MAPKKSRATEIGEAIQAANDALEHLHEASEELDSAGNWGFIDMLGGGFFTSAIKHGRLSAAQDEVQAAKRALKRFSAELRDVDEDAGLDVEIGGILGVTDVLFDNIISDWLVQDRIEDAKRKVAEAIWQVERARDQLCRMR